MCWPKHLPGASIKEDVCWSPVPVSACGTSFHDIIQNMTEAAQVSWSFTSIVSAGRLTQLCEECGAETEVSVISLSFCLLMFCMGRFSFSFFSFFFRAHAVSRCLGNLGLYFMKLQTFSWIYFPLTGPVGSERPSRQKWSPRERWWGWQRWGAWAAWFSRTAGECAL